ncbi:MAG: NUDIX hydrolase [Cytophagales bacterium]|nr:MAG: NUDIX hydrolase [Cytophagales bacterium]
MQEASIIQQFGNRVRLRPCGIVIEDNSILLIKHIALNKEGVFWSPPGGGLKFGEAIDDCIQREFLEETGLKIAVKKFLGIYEYLQLPLHAVELFYECQRLEGEPLLGIDPELKKEEQIIQEVRFIHFDELSTFDKKIVHPFLHEKISSRIF